MHYTMQGGLQLVAELCMQEVLAVFSACIFLRCRTATGDDLQRAASLATQNSLP